MKKGKTGGEGGEWVEYDSPKPPPVEDIYKYWADPPPELSDRCKWWIRQMVNGWRPNRHMRGECSDCSAEWYGIYLWEFINVICVVLKNGRFADYKKPPPIPDNRTPLEKWLHKEMADMFSEELEKAILRGDGTGG